jgi:signal transduction histidine kinase
MKRFANILKHALGVLAMLCYVILCLVAGHFVTPLLYGLLGVTPGELVRQVVTALVGIFFMGTAPTIFRIFHQPREMARWRAITVVLTRIAQGDFSARIETALPRGEHPFQELVHGINDMAVELDRLERLRQEFISNVSHEIQSPLTSIGGFAQALRGEGLSLEQRRRYLEIIETEAGRLSKLSDNLLKLTALEAEQPPVELVPYRLDAQLRRVILAAEPQWNAKEIELEVGLEPTSISADQALLDQVWVNLLHNAVKFTPAGGTIAVRLHREGANAIVSVTDSGIGISAEDRERVFERFFKADRARNREAGGSGLGLALVKKIVSLHGGSVTVASTPGQGTTFTVSLPEAPLTASPAPHGSSIKEAPLERLVKA